MTQDFNDSAGRNAGIVRNLSDDALLDLVQRQTLKYFTDFAHPASGMARERSNVVQGYGYDLDCVTTGGTGFGIMAMIAGAERGFITPDALTDNVTKIVDFLETADKFHGVFPHFLNGKTGKTIPFSPQDDGGDLVETSFLMMGLLSARQKLGDDPKAAALCARITKLWEEVEWDWHTQNNSGKLYWHWSPHHGFAMNLPIEGWNECLVTHVLAAASPTHPVAPQVYENSWLKGHDFSNGTAVDNIPLPLGPPLGGPLFYSHYSFLGLDPQQMRDKHADYFEQNRNHTLINRAHCVKNLLRHDGYGPGCWGLTASDDPAGYDVHTPLHDNGTISPTAALSAFPYTPDHSMQALRHFYEDLGGKIWRDYGFVDAFNESEDWYAESHLAIDQGPIVVMIENHRSGLLWELFMDVPGVRQSLKKLGFDDPAAPQPGPRQQTGATPPKPAPPAP